MRKKKQWGTKKYFKAHERSMMRQSKLLGEIEDSAILSYLNKPGERRVKIKKVVLDANEPSLDMYRIDKFDDSLIGLHLIKNRIFTQNQRDDLDVDLSVTRMGKFVESVDIIFTEGFFGEDEKYSTYKLRYRRRSDWDDMDECETDQISQSKNKATKKRYGVQFSIFDSYTTAEINMLLKAIDMLEEIVNDKKEELNKQLEEEKSKTLFKDLMDLDNVTSAGNLIIDSEV